MTVLRFNAVTFISLSLCSTHAWAADVGWDGAIDSDASNGANWVGGSAPTGSDRAVFRNGDNGVADLGAANVSWNQIFFNSAGSTTINGSGTITLTASEPTLAIESAGGPLTSIINPNVTTTGVIQANGQHNLVFNGNVSANKFEAFNNSTLTITGNATQTGFGGFVTVNATGRVNFAGTFTNTFPGEFGLNGDGGAVYFAKFIPNGPPGASQIINLHSGKTIGSLADNAFTEAADIFARSNSTFDLNGFSDQNEFLGTNAGTTLTIDFGTPGNANSLNWQASHHMNGLYEVINFEIGIDSLQLGSAGPQFFSDAQLATITINGIAYSATDLDTPYWTRDEDRFVVFHNVPEPASMLLLTGAGLVLGASRTTRRRCSPVRF